MRNYDTTIGQPYTRVDQLRIDYGQDSAVLTITESESVVLGGRVRQLSTALQQTAFTIQLTPESLAQSIPLVHPATGADIGQVTTLQQAVMVITAVVRAKQKERDAAAVGE